MAFLLLQKQPTFHMPVPCIFLFTLRFFPKKLSPLDVKLCIFLTFDKINLEKFDRYTIMESRWYLFPGQTIENTNISDRAHALHLTKNAWSGITRHLDRKKRIQEALDKEKAHKKWLKDESEAMTKQWPNSIENMRRRKENERGEEQSQKKQDKIAMFYKMKAEQDEIRKEYVAKMRKEIFQSTGYPKELTSALILSETLYERQKQLEFDDKLKEHELEEQRKYAEKVAKDAQDEKEEKAEEKRTQKEKRVKMRCLLREQ